MYIILKIKVSTDPRPTMLTGTTRFYPRNFTPFNLSALKMRHSKIEIGMLIKTQGFEA